MFQFHSLDMLLTVAVKPNSNATSIILQYSPEEPNTTRGGRRYISSRSPSLPPSGIDFTSRWYSRNIDTPQAKTTRLGGLFLHIKPVLNELEV